MNDEYVLAKGYKEYTPTHFHNESIVKCFQKRFDDNIGKKYFIDINKWSWREIVPYYKRDKLFEDYTYEYKIQMYKKDTHDAVDLSFHGSWTLEMVEDFVEDLWLTGMFDYYEKLEN